MLLWAFCEIYYFDGFLIMLFYIITFKSIIGKNRFKFEKRQAQFMSKCRNNKTMVSCLSKYSMTIVGSSLTVSKVIHYHTNLWYFCILIRLIFFEFLSHLLFFFFDSIVIKSFSVPSSSIDVIADGLNWKASGLELSISGHFHYKLHKL